MMTEERTLSHQPRKEKTEARPPTGMIPAPCSPTSEIPQVRITPPPHPVNPPQSQVESATLEELRKHQMELEAQNEALRQTQEELDASRARYWDLYHLAPIGYITIDARGVILEANGTIATQLQSERSAIIGQQFEQFIVREDRDIFRRHRRHLRGTSKPDSIELRLQRGDDRSFWARLDATLVRTNEHRGRICHATISDITERKQLDAAQLFLLQCGYSNEDFFESLARYLSESLDMDYACIDRLVGEGLFAQTVAVYFDGQFEDNITYALKDTPCANVVGRPICCYNQGVRQLFPRDTVLQEMAAESYTGTTLWSSKGQPIGLIALIGRKPLENPRLAEYVLKLVAVRAAGELERRQAEEALRASLAEKEVLLREVHHRVKNNMASILGLISLQLMTESDPKVMAQFTDLRHRVHSMALVHDLLYQSKDLSHVDMEQYLGALVSSLSGSYAVDTHASVSAEGVRMDLDTAIHCGLIANELMTNAFKHAFPDGRPGPGEQRCEVAITLAQDSMGYTLTVRDNGKGLGADWDWAPTQSLGLQLVKLLSERQLRGTIEVDCTRGTTFRVHFPPVAVT